jgi:hypothetical protein
MVRRVFCFTLAVWLLAACVIPIKAGDAAEINDPVSAAIDTSDAANLKINNSGDGNSNVVPEFNPQVQEIGVEHTVEEDSEHASAAEPPPAAINPLTGLPVQDPQNLLLPPALVSITNFPPTARPQAGLTYSPIVFELYIGDGMTRYLAIFYGDYPEAAPQTTDEILQDELSEGVPVPEPEIGPIRSGRLPYESVRKLFNGFIVMASAYSEVAAQLNDFVNVFGDDRTDVNSALIPVSALKDIAEENETQLGEASLSGMVFDPQPPEGGKDAHSLWIYYAYKNQVFWRYNSADGAYRRWQDNADGVTFIEQTDRLNGQSLSYENVIVLFADHTVEREYLIDIDLLHVKRGKALLFRDEKVYEIYWTTRSEEYEKTTGKMRPIRFIDAEGNPFPLKPGQTWIELIPNYDVYWETVNSEKYNQLIAGRSKGSGYWGLDFELDD